MGQTNAIAHESSDFSQLADEFKQVTMQLFAQTSKADRLLRMADNMRMDAQRLASNRGSSAPTIGFFGPKNAGKSYLLSRLMKNASIRSSVNTGYGDKGGTEQLIWYGRSAPKDMDPVAEKFHPINSQVDTWLAREIVLVDIPGFTDPDTKAVVEHSLTSCQLKILVLDAAEVEREDAVNYGEGFDGAYILPVINRLPGDPDQLDVDDYQQMVRRNLQRWAPHATCFAPVFLPYLKFEGVTWTVERFTQTLAQAVLEALDVLSDSPDEGQAQIALRIERFRAEVRRELPAFTQAIEQVTEQIDAVTATMSEETQELIGGERVLQVSARMGMGAKAVNETPSVFFPYRSIQRLLMMTSGAWESLTMGIAGSIPSLALTAVKSVRNTRDKIHWSQEIETGLRLRLEKTAYEKVLPTFQQLCDVLQDQRGRHSSEKRNCMPSVEVTGVEILMDESRRLFARVMSEQGTSRAMNYLFGGSATLLFFTLMAAPLVALYKDYVLTAWHLLQTHQVVFSDFPSIQWGVLFGAILLSAMPVFILAGLFLSFALSRRRIRRCVVLIQEAHKQLIGDLIQTGRLRIFARNPQLEAAQWLGDFLRR